MVIITDATMERNGKTVDLANIAEIAEIPEIPEIAEIEEIEATRRSAAPLMGPGWKRMLFDYVGLIPGFAAALMSLMLMAEKIPRWKRFAIIVLTIIAMGASGTAQWWSSHQKQQEQAQRSATREQLGTFQAAGQPLQQQASDPNSPLPSVEAEQWAILVMDYLKSNPLFGPSYVVRFNNSAGIPTSSFSTMPQARYKVWFELYVRIARLDQFASEISH